MAQGDISLLWNNELLRLPGDRRRGQQAPRAFLGVGDSEYTNSGALVQYGSAGPIKFVFTLDWLVTETQRDWLEGLVVLWDSARKGTGNFQIELWDETRVLPDLNPPIRDLVPGTSLAVETVVKTSLYPRLNTTISQAPKFTDAGHNKGEKVYQLSMVLVEGDLIEYGGDTNPPIPGGITEVS